MGGGRSFPFVPIESISTGSMARKKRASELLLPSADRHVKCRSIFHKTKACAIPATFRPFTATSGRRSSGCSSRADARLASNASPRTQVIVVFDMSREGEGGGEVWGVHTEGKARNDD